MEVNMSATRGSPIILGQTKKMAGIAIGAIALLAMTGPALSAEAASKDEVLTLTAAIQVPSIPALTNFDISYFNPVMKKYLLAARDTNAIAIFDTTNNSIKLSDQVFGGNTGSNTTAGPNGVWTVNDKEIWAGDGFSKSGSTIKVLDATGALIHTVTIPGLPISPAIPTGRVDEGCFDPVDQLVVAGSNQEKPWPWINFIATSGPNAYTVVKTLVFDGLNGTVMATNSIEQCQWDAKTGKIYLNIPAVNGPPGIDSVPGAVVVIDPVSMSVANIFTIPLSACTGPMGMAIGPENQILLGCSSNGTAQNQNSAIINARSGAVESVLTGYGGTDEVWFNGGDGHYILPFCPAACRTVPAATAPEQIGVIDSHGFRADQSVTIASPPSPFIPGKTGPSPTMRRVKSVASDPSTNQVYIPIPGLGGTEPIFAPTICSSASIKIGKPDDNTGCIAVFTFTSTE
jgi:hypothetical protein